MLGMNCRAVRLVKSDERETILCDWIGLVGHHMPGFYTIWRDGERVGVINGAYITEITESECDLDRNLMGFI